MKIVIDKIREYINTHGNKQILGFIIIFVILAALPLTVIISQQQQEIRQRASEPVSPLLPISQPPVASSSRVFVTSATYNGNLGGLSGADAKCQESANAAKLGGIWKAWLSDQRTYSVDRLIHANAPYKLAYYQFANNPDPVYNVADNWTDLVDSTNLKNAIDYDEFGKNWKNYLVWSNTDSSGYRDSRPILNNQGSGHCNNWTSNSDSDVGRMGVATYKSPDWTSDPIAIYKPCNASFMHLYCFEQPANPVISPTLSPIPTAVLTVSPTSVDEKGSLTVSWSGVPNPTLGDFMNFMTRDGKKGIAYHSYWIHNNCAWFTPTSGTPQSSGSCAIDLSKEIFNLSVHGPYSLILYSGSTPGVTTVIAKSNNLTIFTTVAPTPTPAPNFCTACSADINKDGKVNTSDLTLLRRCLNKSAKYATGSYTCANRDINKDGIIDILDMNCVARNIGNTCVKP